MEVPTPCAMIGGVVVSVLMGVILTLPISSAAIGISMGITGLAAGAATVGCCCQMVGFAVASYRENNHIAELNPPLFPHKPGKCKRKHSRKNKMHQKNLNHRRCGTHG